MLKLKRAIDKLRFIEKRYKATIREGLGVITPIREIRFPLSLILYFTSKKEIIKY